MKYIGIDIGTTGGKVAVFSENMEPLWVWRRDYPTYLGEGGSAEQDPEDWWPAAADGDPAVHAGACDSREIREKLPVEEQIRIAGSACKEVSFLNKLLFFRENMPEKYGKTAVFLQPSGYLLYRMTGRASMDASHGELLFLVDKERGDYSHEVFETFSLDRDKFPPIHLVDKIAGKLTSDGARKLGLPQGTPVLSGGHDSALSAYALGVLKPGDACLDIGNAANLVMCTEKPVYCPAGDAYRHPREGKWLFQIYSATIGAALRWFRDVFGKEEVRMAEEQGISVYDLLCETAREAAPGSGGLLFLPYLQGAQQSAEASGAFLNIRMGSGRPEFVRALLEGCAYSVRYNMEQMEEASGLRIGKLTVCGGGSKNSLWLQIFADILQKPLQVSRIQEAAIAGAAMLAKRADTGQDPGGNAGADKTVFPNEANGEIYDRGYAEFKKAFEEALENKNCPSVIECIIDRDEKVLPMIPPGGSFDDIIVD